jgi:hypothetical protein
VKTLRKHQHLEVIDVTREVAALLGSAFRVTSTVPQAGVFGGVVIEHISVPQFCGLATPLKRRASEAKNRTGKRADITRIIHHPAITRPANLRNS